MGSQSGGGHHTPIVDWVAVFIMLFGVIGLGLALPFKSWLTAVVAAVVFVIGAVIALAYGIVNHTEDYEMGPSVPADESVPSETPARPRIRSA